MSKPLGYMDHAMYTRTHFRIQKNYIVLIPIAQCLGHNVVVKNCLLMGVQQRCISIDEPTINPDRKNLSPQRVTPLY